MSPWHWHPSAVAGLLALLAAYLLAAARLRRRHGRAAAPRPREVLTFASGLVLLAGAVLGPLAEWAEHGALSAHMLQHLVLTLAAPPLLLAGLTPGLLAPAAARPAIARAGYVLTRPAVALLLAAATLVLWHRPTFFDAALRHESLHALEHVTLLATALLAWWPVVGRLPAWPRPTPPAQLLYLFLCTIPMTAVAAPITVAEEILYPFYAATAVGWPLAPRADQELAGVLMWMGGTLAYLVAGTVVFFRWALAEEPAERGSVALSGADSR
jgi:putative membrane protein